MLPQFRSTVPCCFYFVIDVVGIGEVLRLVRVGQVPVDKDQIQESTNEPSYKRSH